ncbi:MULTISPECIES: LytTR family DNA-binding domain-containing protein [Pedobacter]|uniref:LytR/AlgR family response regulator transcription factor n=1 Tax=Pedobacter TaxID=84567 RepID=UPI00292F9CF7|nr:MULTISPECIES: LytTR family DNA-binding domain-containing protein [Pedobacter]
MKKLIVNSHDSLRVIAHSDITFCKSDNCYTSIFLNTGEELVMCRSIKKISEALEGTSFIRVNRSYLINRESIKLVDKKNKHVELNGGECIPYTTSLANLVNMISDGMAVL